MNAKSLIGFLTAVLLALPLAADQAAEQADKARRQAEEQMRKAEQQMREAEQQMRDAERMMRDAARQLGRGGAMDKLGQIERKVVVFSDRARLGLVLRPDRDAKTDAIGAYVEALTPGSPAEEAGLQPGDIIVKYNGEKLADARVDADEDESIPTARLMELARSLKDGDKVTLEVRRGAATKSVTVTAARAVGPGLKVLVAPRLGKIEIPDLPDIDMPDMDIDVDVLTGARPWRNVEMVELNPDLGSYFGTTDGILVVRAPKEGGLNLKAGDVILKIGDRTPTTPAQAMRILRSYEPGETVPLEVMRNRQKVALSIQMPERHGRGHRDAPAPPAPPEPPKPPQPAPPSSEL